MDSSGQGARAGPWDKNPYTGVWKVSQKGQNGPFQARIHTCGYGKSSKKAKRGPFGRIHTCGYGKSSERYGSETIDEESIHGCMESREREGWAGPWEENPYTEVWKVRPKGQKWLYRARIYTSGYGKSSERYVSEAMGEDSIHRSMEGRSRGRDADADKRGAGRWPGPLWVAGACRLGLVPKRRGLFGTKGVRDYWIQAPSAPTCQPLMVVLIAHAPFGPPVCSYR